MELSTIKFFMPLFITLVVVFLGRQIVTYKGMTSLRYILTPLITAGIAGVAILAMVDGGMNAYRILILVALIFSLIADTLLMIKEVDLLQFGIVYFLVAHLIYIAAFSMGYTFHYWNVAVAAVLAVNVLFVFKKVKGNTGGLDISVLVYAIVISIMVFLAIGGLGEGITRSRILAMVGALLFILSDFALAWNAFVKPIPHASMITWALYGPAQLLIALSGFGS